MQIGEGIQQEARTVAILSLEKRRCVLESDLEDLSFIQISGHPVCLLSHSRFPPHQQLRSSLIRVTEQFPEAKLPSLWVKVLLHT